MRSNQTKHGQGKNDQISSNIIAIMFKAFKMNMMAIAVINNNTFLK